MQFLHAQKTKGKIILNGTYYAKVLKGVKYLEHDSYLTFKSKTEGSIKEVYKFEEDKYQCKCTLNALFTYQISKGQISFNYSKFVKEPSLQEGNNPQFLMLCCSTHGSNERQPYTNKLWVLNGCQIQLGGIVYTKL
jgi:hypothetical protein